MIANVNSKLQNVVQIKNGILIVANTIVKSIVKEKKIIAGILTHLFVTVVGI